MKRSESLHALPACCGTVHLHLHSQKHTDPARPLVSQVPPMIIEPALWVVQPSGVMAKVPLTVLESRGSTEVRQPAMHRCRQH